jgi:hypothetical protein
MEYHGTGQSSLFGWAGSLPRLLVTVAVALGIGLLGTSTFLINAINTPPPGWVAAAALFAEPIVAVGFARGTPSHGQGRWAVFVS